MRTALILLSLLLFQVAGGGLVLDGTHDAGPSDRATTAGDRGVTATAVARAAGNSLINRIALLTLAPQSRERLASQSLNVTAAVSIGRDDAAARLDAYAFEERLNRTGDPDAAIAAELDAVAERVDALRESKRALWRRYANGTIDASPFVRGTARLQARALQIRFRLDRIRGAIDRRDDDALLERVDGLEHELIGLAGPDQQRALAGPVRKRVLAALQGTAGSVRVYAAASEHGFVFAAITGSGYVREAYRGDHHSQQSAPFTLPQAAERAEQLYPVAFDLDVSLSTRIVELSRRIPLTWSYRIESDLPVGSLRSYLDGTTRNVFYEIQRRNLADVVQQSSVAASANGTRLVVNQSYPGGPLRVAVRDNATRAPVDTTVRVGEARLRTGPDGVVWTLTPPEATFAVRAIRPSGNVTAAVSPLAPTSINASS